MIAHYKTEVPFLRLVLCFIVGISSSITQNLAPNFISEFTFYCLCGLVLFSAVFYQRSQLYLKRSFTGLLVYFTMLMAGVVITNQHKEIYERRHFSRYAADELIAVINENPKIKGDIARFTVKVKANVNEGNTKPGIGKLLVALRFDSTKNLNLNYGDLILLKAKFQVTEPPYNFAEFNYKRYLSFQNIYHQTFINQRQIAVVDSNCANPIISFALRFRDQQVAKLNRYLKDDDAKAVASTLVLGYRATLDKELLNTYSNTGTMHVLSVSGMHVAIVVFLLSKLLVFMDKNKRLKVLKVVLMISLVWFYALITGLAPSVTRAALMISFVLIAKAKSKPVNIFNVLAISAFILLLHNPFNLVNVGFQLSYIAVGGLIYLYPKISEVYQPQNPVLKYIWATMAVSIAAQIITAPFSLFYFHQFPVYFILSNVFIVIPATLIMYTGFAFLILVSFLPQITIVGSLLNELINFTNSGLKAIENIPHANITQVWLSPFEIGLCYLVIILLFLKFKTFKPLWITCIIVVVLVSGFSVKAYQHIQQRNVTFFSLRKNTAVAFMKGRSAVLITDLDSSEFNYRFSVKPYLDSCNVTSIRFVNPHNLREDKIYRFENKSLKIINQANFQTTASKQNWLLLSSDRISNLERITSVNEFEILLIDGRNRDFVIENLKAQAVTLKLPTQILKRSFSLEYKLPF